MGLQSVTGLQRPLFIRSANFPLVNLSPAVMDLRKTFTNPTPLALSTAPTLKSKGAAFDVLVRVASSLLPLLYSNGLPATRTRRITKGPLPLHGLCTLYKQITAIAQLSLIVRLPAIILALAMSKSSTVPCAEPRLHSWCTPAGPLLIGRLGFR